MRLKVLLMIITVLSLLLLLPSAAFSQGGNCPAEVYYNESSGEDVGPCSTRDDACKTMDYALAQGQKLCPSHVYVSYAGPNEIDLPQLEWLPAADSTNIKDALWQVGRWAGPAVGLMLGWFAAWTWTDRRSRGVA